ncbi:LLM class flavin-dependent oxidoreductase [Amycolatopsis nigrescens]|uniref:LLM class flavin-dependent oxidoreductase n=1 Tax=Amycolatopsis nigrescens TaxID=381445 RepID=UPI000366925A|nr:LLM class flavin-dependent oxidoreductase [Amycolatopsis nigrescens]
MRVGITILPEYRWTVARPKWQAVERYGFDHAWTFDHLGWRSLVDGPWFGSVPTLTAAALATSRIELGPLVASPNIRHPIPYARELTALDDVSEGRLTVGLGAGSATDYDSTVFGADGVVSGRGRRFGEFIELLDALLTGEPVSWQGEYYEAVQARVAPGCVQRPRVPFVVAANGPKVMRLAARFGHGWITTGGKAEELDGWWAAVADVGTRFDEALAETGRPHGEPRRFLQTDAAPVFSLSSVECYRDFLGRAGELGFTDVVAPWPRSEGVFAGSESVLEQVAAEVLPSLDR